MAAECHKSAPAAAAGDYWERCQDMVALAALEMRLQAQMTRVLELHPVLADPVPPISLPRVNGTFSMKVSDVWQDLVRRWRAGEYRMPIADSLGRLVGPIRSSGYCLEPIRTGVALDYYDPRVPAQDGDFVLVQWYPPVLQAMVERNRHKPEWIASYGEQPGPLATKLLKRLGNEWWLLTNESALPLGRNTIRGVLAHAELPAVVHAIAEEAATEVVQSTPADGSAPVPDINTGSPFSDSTDIATVAWANPLNEVIDVIVDYKGLFSLDDTNLSGMGRFAYLRIDGDVTTYTESTVGFGFHEYVEPDRRARGGSQVIPVNALGTVTARVRIGVTAAPGIYTNIPDANFYDVSVSIKGIKR